LVRYDLKRKASKVIVADTKTDTPWPAISKDGKKIAVAEYTLGYVKDSKEFKGTFRIIVYDLDGKGLSRTKVHEVTGTLEMAVTTTEERPGTAYLNWSGPADKILVVGSWGPSEGSHLIPGALLQTSPHVPMTPPLGGICDLKKEKFTPIEGIPFPNRPVRPDDKGFLAKDATDHVFYYDWDGGKTSLGNFPSLDDTKKEAMGHVAWVKNTFRVYTTERTIDIDTEGGVVSLYYCRLPWPFLG
jgi:hypothetical protein